MRPHYLNIASRRQQRISCRHLRPIEPPHSAVRMAMKSDVGLAPVTTRFSDSELASMIIGRKGAVTRVLRVSDTSSRQTENVAGLVWVTLSCALGVSTLPVALLLWQL